MSMEFSDPVLAVRRGSIYDLGRANLGRQVVDKSSSARVNGGKLSACSGYMTSLRCFSKGEVAMRSLDMTGERWRQLVDFTLSA